MARKIRSLIFRTRHDQPESCTQFQRLLHFLLCTWWKPPCQIHFQLSSSWKETLQGHIYEACIEKEKNCVNITKGKRKRKRREEGREGMTTGMASLSKVLLASFTTRAPPLNPAARQTASATLSAPSISSKQTGRYNPSQKTSGVKNTSPRIISPSLVRTSPS